MSTTSENFLPSNTGQDLGAPGQRWDVVAQNVDVAGTLTATGLPSTSVENVWTAIQDLNNGAKFGSSGVTLTFNSPGVDLVPAAATRGELRIAPKAAAGVYTDPARGELTLLMKDPTISDGQDNPEWIAHFGYDYGAGDIRWRTQVNKSGTGVLRPYYFDMGGLLSYHINTDSKFYIDQWFYSPHVTIRSNGPDLYFEDTTGGGVNYELRSLGGNFELVNTSAGAVRVTFSAAGDVAPASVTVGGGTSITKMKVYSQALTPASVAAATSAEQSFTVAGLTTADKVTINPPTQTNSAVPVYAYVSAADTLKIGFMNPTAGGLTPAAGTYTILAVRS
jgi:hypothetical protein